MKAVNLRELKEIRLNRLCPLVFALSLSVLTAACGTNAANNAPDAAVADLTVLPPDLTPPPVPPNLGCLDGGAPPAVPAMITVSGKVNNPLNKNMDVSGTLVEAFAAGQMMAVTSTTAPADGSFAIHLTTGGNPWQGYLKITKAADATVIPVYLYAAAPLRADITGASVPVLRHDDLSVFSNIAQVTPEKDKSTLFIIVRDCVQKPVEAATVMVSPMAGSTKLVYFTNVAGAPVPSRNATATSKDGVAVAFNVPPDGMGHATVTANWQGTPFLANTVGAWADSLVVMFVEPR